MNSYSGNVSTDLFLTRNKPNKYHLWTLHLCSKSWSELHLYLKEDFKLTLVRYNCFSRVWLFYLELCLFCPNLPTQTHTLMLTRHPCAFLLYVMYLYFVLLHCYLKVFQFNKLALSTYSVLDTPLNVADSGFSPGYTCEDWQVNFYVSNLKYVP